MKSAIFQGVLMHNRVRPKKHRFSYNVVSWLIDLDELDILNNNYRFFSRNRLNLISFHDSDYGDGSETPLKTQINQLLMSAGLASADRIQLLCYPRVLGYVFNPLSVYYCFISSQLTSIVYEVSNTFGERHSYVISAEEAKQEEAVHRQMATKKLHVSPFFPMDCYYHFKTRIPNEQIQLSITLHDRQGKLFAAVLSGIRQEINDQKILWTSFRLPLQTIKVVAAIHWEALRLWVKGIQIIRHVPQNRRFGWSRGKALALTNKKD